MNTPLFRQQAINERCSHLYGEVILKLPLSFRLITVFILSVVLITALLLVYGAYSRKETVTGYLVPNKGLVKIYAPQKGVLKNLHVKEGQLVIKNEILFTVSNIFNNGIEPDTAKVILAKLEQQKENIKVKIEQEQLLSNGKRKTIDIQMTGIQRELSQLTISITLQTKQLNLASIRKDTAKTLVDKGHISISQMQDIEQSHLDNKVLLRTSLRQQTQLENRNFDLLQQKKQIPTQWLSRLADLTRDLSELEQRIIELSEQQTYSIRAPISGRLTALQISEGQSISTQSPLIAILPEDTQLQAELFLPTRAAGFAEVGQKVLLRYGAFPYQHYGLHDGYIKEIAHVILAPNELPIPIALNEPVYRVRVSLNKQTVDAFARQLPLQAGMLLSADIVLEERTLVQWLLEPLYELGG